MFTRRYTNFWDGLFRPSRTHLLGSGEVKTLTNLVANGNFVNATGWTAGGGSGAVSDNTYTLTGNGTVSYPNVRQNLATPIVGHKYGVLFRVRVTTTGCTKIDLTYGLNGAMVNVVTNPVQNQWYNIPKIITATSAAQVYLQILHWYANAAASNDKVMEVQYVSCVDLTDEFGAGNEPSQTDYANWIATQSNSWFSTTAQYLCNTNQWF